MKKPGISPPTAASHWPLWPGFQGWGGNMKPQVLPALQRINMFLVPWSDSVTVADAHC